MRVRLATLLALVLIALPVLHALGPAASAAAAGGRVVLAQEEEGESNTEEGEEGGEGQSDPDAETGAGEGEDAPAVEEEGPVWTLQMAWITIALLVMMVIGVALAYYKLVVQRQRAGV